MAPDKPKTLQNSITSVNKRPLDASSEGGNTKPAVRPRIQDPTKEKVTQTQRQTANTPVVLCSLPRHSRFYYDDGSVVFVTVRRGESLATLFRVSRRQLESASTKLRVIFEEAFDRPGNGDQETEMYEGCPVLRLNESTEDVAALFELLWGGLYTGVEDRTHQFVTGVLGLSTKWDIPHLRTWSINYLKSKTPTTYDQFKNDPNLTITFAPSQWTNPTMILKLHHDFNLPRMAAITWYRMSVKDWGTVGEAHVSCWFEPYTRVKEHIHMERLVIGRERIQERCFNFFFGDGHLSELGKSTCENLMVGGHCTSLLPILREVRSSVSDLKTCFKDPLSWAQAWKPLTSTTCESCKSALSSAVQGFAKELFNDLPKIFNL